MTSPRDRDIMRPVSLGDELRAALVVGGRCWGMMCLHREDGEVGFTAAEADLLRLSPPASRMCCARPSCCIRRCLRQRTVLWVVVLDEHLELVAILPEAEALLPLIGHGRPSAAACRA